MTGHKKERDRRFCTDCPDKVCFTTENSDGTVSRREWRRISGGPLAPGVMPKVVPGGIGRENCGEGGTVEKKDQDL